MKKALGVAIVLVLAAGAANSATILGSKHDLSGKGWGTTELCRFCHVAHNGQTGFVAPLWNHAITAATYTTYTSPTMNATVGQPGDYSKACLSCHDGTVAIDSYGTRVGTNFMTGASLMGTNLSNDHPVGITYDAALATTDPGLFNPTTTQSGLGGTISATMLFAGKMECASCHDVHDPALGFFLRNSTRRRLTSGAARRRTLRSISTSAPTTTKSASRNCKSSSWTWPRIIRASRTRSHSA